jgi:2,3-bisphosphoglycerate-independent phosphoglycerate mutase
VVPERQKCVLLIIDGLGDLPVVSLGRQTPLEAARTPIMDSLAAAGQIGLLDPVNPGEIPNTHSGTGMLLGVLPGQLDRLTRGPVEAAGAGQVLRDGQIAIRVNFATLERQDEGLRVIDRRAGRITTGASELASLLENMDLGDGVSARLQPTDQHRCVLILDGPGLDPAVSDTDPGNGGAPLFVQNCRPLHAEANLTAEKVNHFVAKAFELFDAHPINAARRQAGVMAANGLITRGAGAAFRLDNLLHDRGIQSSVVAACNTVRGLAGILGFEVHYDERFTADANTDIGAKMQSAVSALDNHELVFIHVKAPDLFAHDMQAAGKRDFIERLDEAMEFLKQAGVMVALTADHTTDSNSGLHTADPVPALLFDPSSAGVGSPPRVNFGESACRSGNLPRQSSHEFLELVVGKMGY